MPKATGLIRARFASIALLQGAIALSLCLLTLCLLTTPLHAAQPRTQAEAQLLQQQEPANYAFAAYMGSGLYSASDQSLFVLNIPTTWDISDYPDWRFRFTGSAGFFNYGTEDILDLDVPADVGTLTLIPGIEKVFPLTEKLDLIPHLDYGYGRNFATNEEAQVYSVGVRTEFHFHGLTKKNVWVNKLIYAGSRTFDSDQHDNYVQILTGVDYSLSRGFHLLETHNVRPTLYGLTYWSHNGIDYVERWKDGVDDEMVFELGTTLWAPEPFVLFGMEADRIGIGYQQNAFGHVLRLFLGSVF